MTLFSDIKLPGYPSDRILDPPRIWINVPRPVSSECEADLRSHSLRLWEFDEEMLQCYMLESDWHTLRTLHLVTGYSDALFCTPKKFLLHHFFSRRSRVNMLVRLNLLIDKIWLCVKRSHAMRPI